jgi:nucleotide-binding universal stress UspA family protein
MWVWCGAANEVFPKWVFTPKINEGLFAFHKPAGILQLFYGKVRAMLEKIVVPLDGSRLAEVALPYAEELTGKMGAEIILFSVLPSEEPQECERHQIYAQKTVDVTKRHIEKYVRESERGAIKIGTATRIGNPAEGILDYVGEGSSKLIVMATHGRSGISRWAVGSVADKMVRATTKQPLVLVRARGSHPDVRAKRILKKAMVPLDGSKRSEAVIPFVAEIAQSLKMELTLLQVVPKTNHTYADAEAYLQCWCQQLEDSGVVTRYEVRVGAAADVIIDLADTLAMDVVAMSTHGQAAISLWPLGSVAQKVLLGGNTPLLLVRA